MVVRLQKIIFTVLQNDLIDDFTICVKHQCNKRYILKKKQLINVWKFLRQWLFYEELCCNTICNITQESHKYVDSVVPNGSSACLL